jgi:hypothetical protein
VPSNKLTDQAALYRVASKKEGALPLRTLAISKMTDQPLLCKLCSEQPAAAIRVAVISRVTDHDFLLSRSRVDSSRAVRIAAVQAMQQDEYLARVAIENDGQIRAHCRRGKTAADHLD